jgi:hypothetical protein
MRRACSPSLEALEGRELLSGVHAAHAVRPKIHTGVPLALDGTLTLRYKQATTNQNPDGSSTLAVPVSGTLAGLGTVHGMWNESTNAYGNYDGPDTLALHTPQGVVVLAFNNASHGPAHKAGETLFYQHPQKLIATTGAYAGDTESGTINLNSNAARNQIASVTLNGD